MSPKLRLLLLILCGCTSELLAWSWWANPYLDITYDRPIYVNNGCSNDEYQRIQDACKAWYWSGARYRPYVAGWTWRTPLYGSFNDDGVNVIGNYSGGATWLGLASFLDATDDEVDIQMNTGNYSWHRGSHWTMPTSPTQYSYQAVATHELGHFMGLGHSSGNASESNTLLRNATMFYTITNNSSRSASLNRDDLCGILDRAGGHRHTWTIVYNPGYDVRLTKNGNEVQIYIDPKGQGSDWGDWVIVKKENLGGWVDADTRIEWEEYDRDHSAIINPYIVGVDGIGRELYYARNAPNWYQNAGHVGWPDLSTYPSSYNQWVGITKSIWFDYRAEYGVNPAYVLDVKVRHFVNTSWTGDHGCNVRNIYIRGLEPY